ncbi:Elongation factor-like GTPase 1 [Clydaea vesicula]|uniref:Elongation factor 2 n=1 Tax=Clydaea vesicula TaxID=447962 RepID=A0AAD5Y2B3_9FUNG|nr:Elongation factor-like GTPase 1 [Clydaea vesicula]
MGVDLEKIKNLQKNSKSIRNICILAHVDHGKTTLSDSLLASNGIISSKLSGKVRYLDSREDEQQRGITMKSSGISLYFKVLRNEMDENTKKIELKESDFLINLIDSPGHVDFASEVSTASRLSDGGLVLVDAVEGVCTQTHTVLRQAWSENVKPVLVINKVDRLINELKMSAVEAYEHLKLILEQVNAITGTMFSQKSFEDDNKKYEENINDASALEDWNLDLQDDSNLYFSPEVGNVIFASAIDGWAFRIEQFAKLYASKLKIKEQLLKKALWGDYYLDTKAKRVVGKNGLKGRPLKPLFVQFVLENIWAVYDAVCGSNDKQKIDKIVTTLNLKINARDLKSKDSKALLKEIMTQWVPLSNAILLTVIEQLPSPVDAQPIRMPQILKKSENQNYADLTSKLQNGIYSCNSAISSPSVAYISKIFSVPKKELPSQKLKKALQTAEEMKEKREKYLAALKQKDMEVNAEPVKTSKIISEVEKNNEGKMEDSEEEVLIGFARIFSGTIRNGDKLFLLGPKYSPEKKNYLAEIIVEDLYLLMGRELEILDEVPAGNVFGINFTGAENLVLKTATISSTLDCPNFGSLNVAAAPIVRVALEPADPSQMQKLVEGLKLLNQADPCVEIIIQETGEHVIVTAGELHLERCLKDLRERFAKMEIHVSEAIVPFRETITNVPSVLSPNLQLFISNNFQGLDRIENKDILSASLSLEEKFPTGTVILKTANKLCTLRVRALPLPKSLANFLYEKEKIIKAFIEERESPIAIKDLDLFFDEFNKTFFQNIKIRWGRYFEEADLKKVFENIWAFGPKQCGQNLLVNMVDGYEKKTWMSSMRGQKLKQQIEGEIISEEIESTANNNKIYGIKDFQGSIASGFQMATLNGPLCNEPMYGLCILLEDCTFHITEDSDALKISLLSGQIITTMREACKLAFLQWSPRLMTAMYSCELQAPCIIFTLIISINFGIADVLGKVYAVLAKRKGRILSEEMKDGTPYFSIKSLLPVVESFGFAEEFFVKEIRKRTSGAASPQLIFQGFEILDIDPFWVPTTELELEDLGEKSDKENFARKYLNFVRKRKGMFIETDKVVEFAEKQKTLKNK